MNPTLQFDPAAHQLIGPAGSLLIPPSDQLARRFLMLVEGQCMQDHVATVAQKYDYSRQRYYQLLDLFKQGGLSALEPKKTGPKSNYRRTDEAVRQVLRHRFLDPDVSAEVIAQKLRQTDFDISIRSIERVIADFGIQKKTLRAQPQKPASAASRPTRSKASAPAKGRRHQSGTRRSPKPG